MIFLVTSTTWRWTNGVCHDIHMDDGDTQLPIPAQQPESDLCLVSTTFSIANRRWGVSAISCKVAESGWYSNADKASFNSKGECFPVIRHCRHAESSTTHCSLAHSTISSLCSPESPQRHHLSTLSQLLSLLQSIFPSTRKLLFKIPIPEYPYTDEFITNFPLAIENSKKGAFQACNDLAICASHYCCKSGISYKTWLETLYRQELIIRWQVQNQSFTTSLLVYRSVHAPVTHFWPRESGVRFPDRESFSL